MIRFRRYAVYWAPPAGSALAGFGAAWLGWDADGGRAVPHPEAPGLPAPVAEFTAKPRRYGFHATLKAPFRLRAADERAALPVVARLVAAKVAPFEAPPLALKRIGRFIALVPSGACEPLSALADHCVETFHDFAAEPPEAELDRRRPGLTGRQEQLLGRWFYPYVFDEFRFHLTLTGALEPEIADRTFDVLRELTAPFCAAPMPVTEVCLFGEGEDRHFQLIGRYPLTG
ncbi:MAG TPA: DUF1045 domain-containing protein [Paracoccaceae bacterium]|nr:DUF1045 domain-containing protein [Paracoccaceae bacterium]